MDFTPEEIKKAVKAWRITGVLLYYCLTNDVKIDDLSEDEKRSIYKKMTDIGKERDD